ncbi:hypothetical protein [Aeromicrobium wangtongii]|uniref:Phosphodiesterase n=1 Tax=Aeromicrobium wangtongii TaxID=2969247 RepID=A0ABY5M8G7_9ACTN|nr:hypothetical protein [Aeromicrobium wangtongii]MCD9199787.1 hypothetical protein [Aeromicrobium wangtongii]UUP14137.1 hypothetical protein NQV15_02155 [Aeromicrobium wangtongii]
MAAGVATVPGLVLQAAAGIAGLVRPAAKPLHPAGSLVAVTIHRYGMRDVERLGVPFVDEPGTTEAWVRFSRAAGLPRSLPDVHGIALRIPGAAADGADADVLLATTGMGRISRFVLVPARSRGSAAYSTLLPYRSPRGAVVLAAVPEDEDASTMTLAAATPGGQWIAFADLCVAESSASGSGDEISFDPILNMLDGLSYYLWATRLREGSYRAARWSRRVRD